jgi:succinoglycan biosynthesis transport protein ExoP
VLSAHDAELFQLPEELPTLYWLQHWQTARKNWKVLAVFTVCGAALGLLIASFQTPLFHASTSIEVQGITDNLLKSQDGNPNAGAAAELMDLQTQIRIMQSDSLVNGVVEKLAEKIARKLPLGGTKALDRARASLNIHVALQTRIIEIAADSTEPRIAADFVNAVADAYIDQHVAARWQGAERGAARLQSALDDMRVKLEKSEAAVQDYAQNAGLLLSGDRGVVSEDKLRLLQTELTAAQADRIAKQSRFDSVSASTEATLPALVDSPGTLEAESKITDLRRQIAELSTTYTADYSKVKRLRAQLEPLENSVHQEFAKAQERTRSDLEEARQRERLLQSANQAEVESIALDEQKKVHYDALRREVDSTRSLYDTMLSRVKEVAIGSTMRASNVRVLDAAQPASEPFQPRRMRMSLLGSLAGLFLGVGFAAARRQADSSIRSAGELQRLLNVREFGSIDSMRASLFLEAPDDQAQAIVITSAEHAEGKTTIALKLGIAMAEIGKRVLLIDGDLRSPRLHTLLHRINEFGLVDLLTSHLPLLESQVAQAVRSTSQANLELITAGSRAGSTSPDSPGFLYSPRLPELLAYGRKNFDIVLIDSPPMVQIPDARMFGRVADAVLIVVRAGKTSRESVLTVRQKLHEDKTAMTGCVLNDWDLKSVTEPRPFRANLIPGKLSFSGERPA